jgi:hypothetical protein
VKRQLARRAAVDADDEDLAVAAVLAAEGDPPAVGRELGEQLQPRMRGQAPCHAAGRLHHPDVAGIDEGDPVAMDVWKAEQARVALRRLGEGGERQQQQDGGGEGGGPGGGADTDGLAQGGGSFLWL